MKYLITIVSFFALVFPLMAQPDLLFPEIEYQRRPSWADVGQFFPDRGPLVADVTCDGLPEIFVVGYGPGTLYQDRIFVYNSSGALMQTLTIDPEHQSAGYRISQTPAMADLDGDGLRELIACAWQQVDNFYLTFIYKWEFEGGQFQDRQIFGAWGGKATCTAVADVTGDGRDDLVFIGWDVSEPNVYLLYWYAHEGWWLSEPYDGLITGISIDEAIPALGDLTGDDVADVFVLLPGSGNGYARLEAGEFSQTRKLMLLK